MIVHGLTGMTTGKLSPHVRQLTTFGLIAALAGGTFVIDCSTPRTLPVWILYVLPITLTLWTPQRWSSASVTGLCLGLTFLGHVLGPHLPEVPAWLSQVGRSLSLGLFPSMAYVIDRQKRLAQELVRTATVAVENEILRVRQRLLAQSADEVRDLYDHAPCGYHSLDVNGLLVAVNQTEVDWLGYTKEDLIGKIRFADLMTPASAALFKERFARFIKEGLVKDLEFEVVRKDGSVFTVLLSATAVTDSQGRYLLSRTTLIDITDRKRADQALRLSTSHLRPWLQNAPPPFRKRIVV